MKYWAGFPANNLFKGDRDGDFVASVKNGWISDAIAELDKEFSNFCGEHMLKRIVIDVESATDTYYNDAETNGKPVLVRVIVYREHST